MQVAIGMEQGADPCTRAGWLRSEIQRVSQDLIWCLAELRLQGARGAPVAVEDLRQLAVLGGQLHRCTQELCAMSETSGDSRRQALGPWEPPPARTSG